MRPTVDPRRIDFEIGPRGAQIQRPPASSLITRVVAGRPPPTDPALTSIAPPEPDRHDERTRRLLEFDLLDHHLLDTEQPGPYPHPTHAVLQPGPVPTIRTTGRWRALLFSRSAHPRIQQETQESGGGPGARARRHLAPGRLVSEPPRMPGREVRASARNPMVASTMTSIATPAMAAGEQEPPRDVAPAQRTSKERLASPYQ